MKKQIRFFKSLIAVIVAIMMVSTVVPTVAFASEASVVAEDTTVKSEPNVFDRFVQSIVDFFKSIAEFFKNIFGLSEDIPDQDISAPDATIRVSTAKDFKYAVTKGNFSAVILESSISFRDETIDIPAGKKLQIFLNGYTVSGCSTEAHASYLFDIGEGAELTLSGVGIIEFFATKPDDVKTDEKPEPSYTNNTINNHGSLIIDGAIVENRTVSTSGDTASYAIDCYGGSSLNIISGEVIQSEGDIAIRIFADSSTAETNVTVSGGTISGRRAIWLYLPGNSASVAPSVKLTIEGGHLISTTDAEALYSYSFGNSFLKTKIQILDGIFDGNVCFGGGYKGDTESVIISGGTFNGRVIRYITGGSVDMFIP